MIRNILLSAIASLKRKKMASLFTILTISLGMTMIVLLASLYHSYTGNVGPYVNRDRCLYLSKLEFEKDGKVVSRIYPDCKDASSTFINQTLGKIEDPCLVGFYGRISQQNLGSRYKPFTIKSMQTDANFWQIHQFTFLDGKPFSVEELNSGLLVTVISRKLAMKLWGNTKVTGKFLEIGGLPNAKVVGVIDDVNPHFEVGADCYLSYSFYVKGEENFVIRDNGAKVYHNRGAYKGVVLAKSRSDLSRIKREFNKIIDRINQTGQVEEFDKVNVFLKSTWQLIPAQIGLDRDNSVRVTYISMALIFLFLPVIILSNVNLYVLRERLEEIGLRRSFGAKRKDILRQFFIENILVTAIGCMLALFLAYGLNHALAFILYRSAEIPGFGFNLPLFFYLVIGIVVFGLLTIIIPVWRISRIQPFVALHRNDASHSTFFHFKRRKKWMQLATHFLLSLVLLLCSFFIVLINEHISPMGYETENVLRIMVSEQDQKVYDDQYNSTRFEGFRESLLQLPGVKKVSYVLENPPFSLWVETQYQEFMIGNEYISINAIETDSVFFDLLEIKPVKGQLYSMEMVDGKHLSAVTTLAGEKELFNGNAIGQVFQRKSDGQKLKIIGVIKKYEDQPGDEFKGIMVCRNRPSRAVLIKVSPNVFQEDIDFQILHIINNWKGTQFNVMLNDNLDIMKHEQMKEPYSAFHAVILALSFLFLNAFMGYLTLSYYNVQTRKKEMGVRRAAGANKPRILLSILGENMPMVAVGFLFAFVIFWQLLYVSKFHQWELFWQAGWLSLIISLLLTIGSALLPAYIASKVQPVEALGEE